MTHLKEAGARSTACGIAVNTGGVLLWTEHKRAVSCPYCMATAAYDRAVQRIPQVQGGPYRGQ